jgi:hypothetical protein
MKNDEDILREASEPFIKKMDDAENKLTNKKVFRKDETKDKNTNERIHIRYILNEGLETQLDDADKTVVKYEFLIEYNTRKPDEGIYYGCKAHAVDMGKHCDSIAQIYKNKIKDKLIDKLGKKKVKEFNSTSNIHDNTYWPFWIRLNSNESIVKVTARCVVMIYDVYKSVFCNKENNSEDAKTTDTANERDKEIVKSFISDFTNSKIGNYYLFDKIDNEKVKLRETNITEKKNGKETIVLKINKRILCVLIRVYYAMKCGNPINTYDEYLDNKKNNKIQWGLFEDYIYEYKEEPEPKPMENMGNNDRMRRLKEEDIKDCNHLITLVHTLKEKCTSCTSDKLNYIGCSI